MGCCTHCFHSRYGRDCALSFRWRLRGAKICVERLCPIGPIERVVRAFPKQSNSFMQTERDDLQVSGLQESEIKRPLPARCPTHKLGSGAPTRWVQEDDRPVGQQTPLPVFEPMSRDRSKTTNKQNERKQIHENNTYGKESTAHRTQDETYIGRAGHWCGHYLFRLAGGSRRRRRHPYELGPHSSDRQ